MSDKNKSGYQLRADMLGMAYTTEDVIAEAEKLYAFVQKK